MAPEQLRQVHEDYPVEGYVMSAAELQLHNFPMSLRDAAGAETLPPGFASSSTPSACPPLPLPPATQPNCFAII